MQDTDIQWTEAAVEAAAKTELPIGKATAHAKLKAAWAAQQAGDSPAYGAGGVAGDDGQGDAGHDGHRDGQPPAA